MARRSRPRSEIINACLLILPLMLGGGQYSFAQDGRASTLEEVIVTASRREEGLQTIAASITAATGTDLEKQGISGFREMAEAVSGLELKQPNGSISSAVYIRGVGVSGNSSADPSVGVLEDGVHQARPGAVFTELLDIQRIEVLRGPQGTLFGKNTTAGVIRPAKLLWNTSDNFELQLLVEQLNQSARMDSALVDYPPDFLANFGDILPPVSIGKYQQDSAETRDDTWRYVLNANWDLFGHTLGFISSFEKVGHFLFQDRDHTVLEGELGSGEITYLTNHTDSEIKTHELQLSSNFDGPFNYIIGGFWQDMGRVSTTDIYLDAGGFLPRPLSAEKYNSKAVFGNVSYEFSERWNTSRGTRYTEDEKIGSNNIFSGRKVFDVWTYSLKVSCHMDADRMFYFSHDEGFKSGGINREFSNCVRGAPCLTLDEAFLDPEVTYNYEIGVKSEWLDRRLRLNVALFYQVYEDFQINQTVPGDASVLLTNAAEVESSGIETDFVWLATDMTFSGNLPYVKTEYKNYKGAPCALPTSARCVDSAQNLSEKTLDNAPRLTYSIGGEYRDTLSTYGNIEWFGRLDVVFKDKFNLFEMQPVETRQSSYYLLNARVGLDSSDSWKLTLWVKNMTDESYLVKA